MLKNLLAQQAIPLGNTLEGIGNLGKPGGDAPQLFDRILSSAIALLTVIASLYFLFVLISGAISMISAGGDKAAMAEARQKITTGLIGLVVVIAAIFIVELVGVVLDFPNILEPGNVIKGLTP